MSGADLFTDVLVVGSGAVGSTFARLLATTGRRVTMVEAGRHLSVRAGEHLRNAFRFRQEPNLFPDTISAQLETYSVPEHFLSWISSRGRSNFENVEQKWWRNMPAASAVYAVGGMLTLWSASTPDPAPFERAPFIPTGDWEQMLLIAKRLLNVHTDVFAHSQLGQVVQERLVQKGFRVAPLQQAAERVPFPDKSACFIRWSGADTILEPLLDHPEQYRDHFQILAEHRAEQLYLSGGRVTHVLVRDLNTFTTFHIYADTVIVAGGPFLTPRLLWQSGIRPYALGRYLNDNLESMCQVVVSPALINALREMPENPHCHDPLPISHDDPGPALGFGPTPEKPWHGQIHRLGWQFFYLPGIDVRKLVHLTWYGMVDISPNNRITFSDKIKDRFEMPQITIDFRPSLNDIVRTMRMWWDMVRTATAIGSFQELPILTPPGSTLHLQGTCRIGDDTLADERTSVANSYSQVWGIDNLYVGGLGAIPTSMASNPTLTACALAVRAAAHIRGQSLHDLAREIGLHSPTT
jgi:pyranose oxidase